MGSFDVTFTGADGELLSDYVGDDGTTFAKHPNYSGLFKLLSGHATTPSGGAQALWYANWIPAGTDYSLTAAMYVASTQVSRSGPAFRVSPSASTFYYTRFRAGLLEVMRVVAGSQSTGIGATYAIVGGTTPVLDIGVANGASSVDITVDVDGVRLITWSDVAANRITAAGRVGMYWDNGNVGDGTGQSFDALGAADAGGGGPEPQLLTAEFSEEELFSIDAMGRRIYRDAAFEEAEQLRVKLQGAAPVPSSFNVGLARRSRRRRF